MPKRLLLVLAVAALAIAACHSSSTTPSPSSSPASPKPNPSVTKAAVLVTILGTPQPHVPVQESTPKDTSSPRPGTPFDTEYTNKKGVAHFFHLKPSQTYCWVATVGTIKLSTCAGWPTWQSSQVLLGT
ncbi:MAG: hypothetical protein WA431_10735 [Candidatus Cybelea sp.]